MKVVFALDDFCWQYRECISYLEELNDYFDNFKVSLFTIPCYEKVPLSSHWDYLSNVKFKSEHILHGYYHTIAEFQYLNKFQSADYIEYGIKEFKKCGIPIIKGFKGPNWKFSEGLVEQLKFMGFWLATYRPMNIDGLKTYDWSWDVGSKERPEGDVIHAHGHTYNLSGPGKGIGESMENIKNQLPKNIEFLFISEFMKER